MRPSAGQGRGGGKTETKQAAGASSLVVPRFKGRCRKATHGLMGAQRKIALKANKQVVRTPKGIDTSPFPPSTSYLLYLFFAHFMYLSASPKNQT